MTAQTSPEWRDEIRAYRDRLTDLLRTDATHDVQGVLLASRALNTTTPTLKAALSAACTEQVNIMHDKRGMTWQKIGDLLGIHVTSAHRLGLGVAVSSRDLDEYRTATAARKALKTPAAAAN